MPRKKKLINIEIHDDGVKKLFIDGKEVECVVSFEVKEKVGNPTETIITQQFIGDIVVIDDHRTKGE